LRIAGWYTAIVLVSLTMVCAAQQGGEAVPPPVNRLSTTGPIGPGAEWKPTQEFLAKANAACDKNKPAGDAECVMAQMSAAGAPPEAVHVTRILYQTLGTAAIVTDLKKVGLLLVNGDPKILDVNDLKALNRSEMETAPQFLAVKQRFPDADLWPGDHSGSMWPQTKPLPDGGIEFVIGYPILNGCPTCAHVGLALFGWDFDARGKFVKTTYIPLPPPPKKLRRGTVPPPPTP
jgi:hypothetical protein